MAGAGSRSLAALRNPNYKNFLRLVIDETGRLVIFPVGITRVASAWARPTGSRPSLLEPRNGTRPFLIEEPIVIAPPPNDGTSGGRGSGAAPPGAIGAG